MKREICRKLFLLMVLLVFLGLTSPTQAVEVKVYAFKAGLLKTETQYILKDTRTGTPMDIPIPFLIIRHGKEWIAFDTGCNANTARDPVAYWGENLAKAFSPVIGPDQEFARAIKVLGLKPADLKALTDAVGFHYVFDPRLNMFAHPTGIMVATPDGRLSKYLYGIEYGPRDLRLALVEASSLKIGSPVDRVLLYCYHYDPSRGQYGLVALNLITNRQP